MGFAHERRGTWPVKDALWTARSRSGTSAASIATRLELLCFYAKAWKCSRSEVVTSALDSLHADKTVQAAMATQHKGKEDT